MQKVFVPIIVLLLAAELTVAVTIVLAQPNGFGSLVPGGNINFGPERRLDVPAQNLPLNGQAANITINSMGGQVDISGDPSLTEVKVEGTKIIHSFGDADFNRITFNVVQDGTNINIVAKNTDQSFNFGFGDQVDIRVTMPPALLAQLTTTVGSADINARGLQNDKAILVFNTGSGDLDLTNLQASKINAKTGNGDIMLSDYSGSLDANTGSGDITLNGTNRLSAVNFQTGSGDIKATATLNNPTMANVKTGSGDVDLRLDNSTPLGFDINSGSGDIKFNLPGSQVVSKDKHSLKTGGSPVMTIRTGSGDITVE
ncbi:MAG: DUF4097 family beta strand repeat protein [Chloroflexi bacterium]|nr:DUF4097 family beta strand repeat protein [Chloroflexota bacterium]OJW06800.1 MAG: hypothetical protein BGO39_23685 [Chloroflexi bacterium 54-19]